MKRILFLLAAIGMAGSAAMGQLQVTKMGDGGLSAENLAQVLAGSGVTLTNIHYTGSTHAAGVFCGGQTVFQLEGGLVLSSGDAGLIVGANNTSGAGDSNETPGDSSLTALIPGYETHDAAVLEFDFVPVGSTVNFRYVFGSEEYNEFVDSPYNDVFGFFVNGVNYALIPNTQTPVSINNVNNGYAAGVSAGPCRHCEFYTDNTGTNAVATQLDGFTKVLTFTAPVNAGQINHMKIAIADAGDSVLDSDVMILAGSLSSGIGTNFVTRNAKFWFTHPYPTQKNCVNLEDAIQAAFQIACGVPSIDLGFLELPQGYHDNSNVKNAYDATVEALGLYWRNQSYTGELGGKQTFKYPASRLCRERKQLAVEYVSALANVKIFGTIPELMTYKNGNSLTNFPATLLTDSLAALRSVNDENIVVATALLRKFNGSGLTNQFPVPLEECSAVPTKSLKSEALDPTLKTNCPGLNDTCESAIPVSFKKGDIFAKAIYKSSANLARYSNIVRNSNCGSGGPTIVWSVTPEIGSSNRHFTVDTFSSTFPTVLAIYTGGCSSLTEVSCSASANATGQSEVSFTTNGTNTYYIVGQGLNGAVGNLKIKVTSP